MLKPVAVPDLCNVNCSPLHQPVHQYPKGHWSPLRCLLSDTGLQKRCKAAKASPQFSKPHEWFSTEWKVTGDPVFWRTLVMYLAQWIHSTNNLLLRERIVLCLVACWGRKICFVKLAEPGGIPPFWMMQQNRSQRMVFKCLWRSGKVLPNLSIWRLPLCWAVCL